MESDEPTTRPPATPPRAIAALNTLGSWSRPASLLTRGVRLNSPQATTSVASRSPRSLLDAATSPYRIRRPRCTPISLVKPLQHIVAKASRRNNVPPAGATARLPLQDFARGGVFRNVSSAERVNSKAGPIFARMTPRIPGVATRGMHQPMLAVGTQRGAPLPGRPAALNMECAVGREILFFGRAQSGRNRARTLSTTAPGQRGPILT